MTTLYITNYYFEELKELIQNYFQLNFSSNPELNCEILMKNSRTYLLRFNLNLIVEDILQLMKDIKHHSLTKNREVNFEIFTEINQCEHKFYFSNNEIYVINILNQLFKIDNSTDLVPIQSPKINYNKIEIPIHKLHPLEVIRYQTQKKSWWKFWKN